MTQLLRRFRGPAISLVVLTLSAGVTFAAAPRFQPASETDPVTTTETTDVTETTDGSDTTTETTTDTTTDTTTETTTDTSTTTTTEDDGTSTTDDAEAGTHGWWVSQAAQAETPEGFANHGAYVRCVARADTSAPGYTLPVDPVADCGYTPDESTSVGKGKAPKAGSGDDEASPAKVHGPKANHGKGKGSAKGRP